MRLKYFIVIFLFFILSSCSSYQYIDIDVLVPAKYSFPPEIKSVLLVDNSLPYRDSLIHSVKLPDDKFNIDTIWQDNFSSLTLLSLEEELNSRSFFDSVYVHTQPLKTEKKLSNRALNWRQVDSLCSKYNTETVIAFERNIYRTNISVEKLTDGYLFGSMEANGSVLWRAYNILDKELIFQEVQSDTLIWNAEGTKMGDIALNIPNIRNGLADLADYMGNKVSNYIAPYWELQSRGFYNSGNYQFMQATEFIRNDQWEEAINLWKYVFDHSENKIKIRSAYNLALGSEILGDYEASKYWLNQALDMIKNLSSSKETVDKLRVIEYMEYMRKRLKVVDDLKNQIGGFQ